MRKYFEEFCFPNFLETPQGKFRSISGEYLDPVIEDHWQSFQEGWDCATKDILKKIEGDE